MPAPYDPEQWNNLIFSQEKIDELRYEVILKLREEGYDPDTLPDMDTIICDELRRRARDAAWAKVFQHEAPKCPDGWWTVQRGCAHAGEKQHCVTCGWRFCAVCGTENCPRCRAKMKASEFNLL